MEGGFLARAPGRTSAAPRPVGLGLAVSLVWSPKISPLAEFHWLTWRGSRLSGCERCHLCTPPKIPAFDTERTAALRQAEGLVLSRSLVWAELTAIRTARPRRPRLVSRVPLDKAGFPPRLCCFPHSEPVVRCSLPCLASRARCIDAAPHVRFRKAHYGPRRSRLAQRYEKHQQSGSKSHTGCL